MSTKQNDQPFAIEKNELIKGLSLALDLAEQKYMSHSQHVAYLSVIVGRKLGLNAPTLELLFYSALIHDIGASNRYELMSHCEFGAEMVQMLPVEASMHDIILYHHEFVDGSGPFGLKGNEIPLLSQIIHIANQFDYQFQVGSFDEQLGKEQVLKWLVTQRDLFAPMIVDALVELAEEGIFLKEYFKEPFTGTLSRVFSPEKIWYGVNEVKQFAKVFSELIDKRSTFTHQHSTGLTDIVGRMCDRLEYDALTKDKMYIAALLHDIGKLGIDKTIIDKTGTLTPGERYEVEKHSRYSYDILGAIRGFEDISLWAGQHHEKLNGSGYPKRIRGDSLSQQSRLIAICDIYQALTEERPYRAGMTHEQAFQILKAMVDEGALDSTMFAMLSSEIPRDQNI